MLLLLVPSARAGNLGAVVSGVVRDAQGVAQMGALVQILGADASTVATAFTDQHGRYVIANLNPGRYMVRASQTLFVPTSRGNLQLRTGATAVVNLTLNALFDTASWLPAERRQSNEPDDDWKWTLRSTANRPILRMIEDGEVIEISSSATESREPTGIKVKDTVASGDGGFGEGGVHNIIALRRMLDDGGDMMLRADVGSTRVPAAYGPSTELDAGYERRMGLDGASRTVVTYQAHPELVGGGATAGLTVLEIASAERRNLGDLVELEAGGTLDAVHTGAVAFAARPFLRLTAHAGAGWTLHYRLASERRTESFEDVTTGRSEVPVALVENGKLLLEAGRHQEASVARSASRGTFEAVFYHDALERTGVSGGGASGPGETNQATVPNGMLIDPTTGSFRTLASGYKTNGARITVSAPIATGLWVAAEYSAGAALASTTGGDANFGRALAGLKAHTAQAATVAIKGKLMHSQTQVRASYRWQQAQYVSSVDPYSPFSDEAFLSCRLRQPVHLGNHMPQGVAATIDVTNLLAEGYRPFLSEDGQTLYFAQAPRTIQAGLSFSF